jgi:hypothetical protein
LVQENHENQIQANALVYEPAPRQGPPVPGATKARPKTPVRGGGGLRPRWKDEDGKIYEWDGQEKEWEVYDKTGNKHLGSID